MNTDTFPRHVIGHLIAGSILAALAFLCGCAQLPGHVSTTQSHFDGATQVSAAPAWVDKSWQHFDGAGGLKLGVYRNSSMPAGDLVLVAVVKGAEQIAPGRALAFNVDGDIFTVEPLDDSTDVRFEPGVYNGVASMPGAHWSSKRYAITVDQLGALVAGGRVSCRLNLDRSYVDGIISSDAPTTCRPAFRRFLAKVGP